MTGGSGDDPRDRTFGELYPRGLSPQGEVCSWRGGDWCGCVSRRRSRCIPGELLVWTCSVPSRPHGLGSPRTPYTSRPVEVSLRLLLFPLSPPGRPVRHPGTRRVGDFGPGGFGRTFFRAVVPWVYPDGVHFRPSEETSNRRSVGFAPRVPRAESPV